MAAPTPPTPVPPAALPPPAEPLTELDQQITAAPPPPPERRIGEGRTYLQVPVPEASAKPPDVPEEGIVPGGVAVPLTPGAGAQILKRNNYALKFEGIRARIDRIAFSLPVWLNEQESETFEYTESEKEKYATEAEAIEAATFKGGKLYEAETFSPLTGSSNGELTRTSRAFEQLGVKVTTTETRSLSRTMLPITITVIARLNGPNGVLWSDSWPVPVLLGHNGFPHTIGAAIGVATLEQQIDLTNSLEIDPTKLYGLELLVFIPSSFKSKTRLGTILNAAGEPEQGEGSVTFYYGFETGPANK